MAGQTKAKPVRLVCWAVIAVSILLANYAAQHAWPLWSITLAGAASLGAVLAYIFAAETR